MRHISSSTENLKCTALVDRQFIVDEEKFALHKAVNQRVITPIIADLFGIDYETFLGVKNPNRESQGASSCPVFI